MFKVQKKPCSTCIYRKDTTFDLKALEAECCDKYGFQTFRVCHKTEQGSEVCCKGFWNAHKDNFPMGQVAQRLNAVQYVDVL